MLEVDFETQIDNAESGVDEYMVFKDTMCDQSEDVCVPVRVCVCVYNINYDCVRAHYACWATSNSKSYQPEFIYMYGNYGNYCMYMHLPSPLLTFPSFPSPPSFPLLSPPSLFSLPLPFLPLPFPPLLLQLLCISWRECPCILPLNTWDGTCPSISSNVLKQFHTLYAVYYAVYAVRCFDFVYMT